MMPFTVDQLNVLKAEAGGMWAILESRREHGYTEEMQIAFIEGRLREICSTGYHIGLDEVSSTPWEFVTSSIAPEHMNMLSERGWEFVAAIAAPHGGLLWRRRKAVAEIAAKEKPE